MRWIGPLVFTLASTSVLAIGEDWVSIEQATPATSNVSSAPTQVAASETPNQAPLNQSAQTQLLLDELDVLRKEVQALRELTERQGYELRSLKNESKERYLDLDQRLSYVTGHDGEPVTDEAGTQNAASGSEREEYRQAFALLKRKQFPKAEASFKQFIKRYPKGQYTPNGYYWLGELLLLQRKYEEARQAFTMVLNQYGTHQKAPDALYKLGVSFERLGRDQDAKQALQRVVKEYGDRSPTTARLAKEYLAKHL